MSKSRSGPFTNILSPLSRAAGWRRICYGIFASILIAVIAWYALLDPNRRNFPKQLQLSEPIASCGSSGFREGMWASLYRISEINAQAIKTQGLAFFNNARKATNGTALSLWAPTPFKTRDETNVIDAAGRPIYAAQAFGCYYGEKGRQAAKLLSIEAKAGRAYYSTFNGGEGLIVVAPDMRMAAYYYSG